jgi:glycosyltransferase involved in cell wall biosynthesis
MTNPSVSVVNPLFNTERYVGEAIDSVLAQTQLIAEVIVVDDGSTDRGHRWSSSTAASCRWIGSRSGATGNRGIELAQGDLLAFLDADTGRQQRQARADYARVLKQMIDRRRAQIPGKTP